MINSIHEDSDLLTYDDQRSIPQSRMEDLSIPNFSAFCQKLRLERPRMQGMTREAIARALHIASRQNSGRVTLTGLLCFGKYPQAYESSLGIEIYPRGISSTKRYIIEGRLDRMVRDATQTIQNLYTRFFTEKRFPFSLSTLQTLLTNALLHRDYSVQGCARGPIRIFVAPNRFTISNPCQITKLATDRQNRPKFPHDVPNPTLMQLATYYWIDGNPLADNLQNSLLALRQRDNHIDYTIENHRWVATISLQKPMRVTHRHSQTNALPSSIATLQPEKRLVLGSVPATLPSKTHIPRRILSYLQRHGATHTRTLQQYLGCSRITLNKHIRALLDDGLIEALGHPNSPTRRYQYKKPQ